VEEIVVALLVSDKIHTPKVLVELNIYINFEGNQNRGQQYQSNNFLFWSIQTNNVQVE